MLNILFLGTYAEGECLSGPEKVAKRLLSELHLLGHNIAFIEYYSSGKYFNYWKKLFSQCNIQTDSGISVRRMGLFPLMYNLLVNRYDIVHVITFERFTIIAFLLKPICNFSIFVTVHGIVRHQYLNYRKTIRRSLLLKDSICEYVFMRFANCLLFLSEQSRIIASQYYPVNINKVRIVPNGVDEVFRKSKVKSHHDLKNVSIVFIGDIERPEKGYSFFMDALLLFTYSADVFIICEEPPEDAVRKQGMVTVYYIRKMCTTDYVSFLQDKDIYISASSYEPFSISAVEAMSIGLVPIVTKETGMSRYIINGENGFIINYGDKSALLYALEHLSADVALRQRISNEAVNIFSLLTWNKVAQEYVRLYLSYCTT